MTAPDRDKGVLAEARDVLRTGASIDPATIDEARRWLRATFTRAARVAAVLAKVWTAVLAVDLVVAALQIWQFGSVLGWRSPLMLLPVFCFGVLFALQGALIWVYRRTARLPEAIDAVGAEVTALVAQARRDWDAVAGAKDALAPLRTLFSAGVLLRSASTSLREREGDLRALHVAVLMGNPVFWSANLLLMIFSILLPVAAIVGLVMTAVLR